MILNFSMISPRLSVGELSLLRLMILVILVNHFQKIKLFSLSFLLDWGHLEVFLNLIKFLEYASCKSINTIG